MTNSEYLRLCCYCAAGAPELGFASPQHMYACWLAEQTRIVRRVRWRQVFEDGTPGTRVVELRYTARSTSCTP